VAAVLVLLALSLKVPIAYAGATMAVIMIGSPLIVLRTVVRDKSTASLPFAISIVGFINSVLWTLYGFAVADDLFIGVPNALATVAAAVQLPFFVIYGIQSPSDPAVDKAVDKSLDLTDLAIDQATAAAAVPTFSSDSDVTDVAVNGVSTAAAATHDVTSQLVDTVEARAVAGIEIVVETSTATAEN
jgi:hypothetical protein